MKIKVLNKQLANMISAGEVVERPASVVKELVENCIDAGASKVVIEVHDGGIQRIEITDDGCGIDKDEVLLAFQKHATSKIYSEKDLDGIATLGFRGEALASIATVSEVELTTLAETSEIGTKVVIQGGEVKERMECAFVKGTKIVVKNLFYNTPARKKFLSKPKIEENEITKIVQKFMLSYPHIKFQYKTNGKMIYNTAGTGLLDNIYTIYGAEIANNLVAVNYTEGDYTLEGYISTTNLTKPNKSFQVSFLNGRMVKDMYMENAIMVAYQDYLMHGNYPVCFLNLKMPYESVDVNIHPNKQQVKYENIREITKFFITAITDALDKNHNIKFSEMFAPPKQEEDHVLTSFVDKINEMSPLFGTSYKRGNNLNLKEGPKILQNISLELDEDETESYNDYVPSITAKLMETLYGPSEQCSFEKQIELPKFKIIGTAFSTYILVEIEEKLLVIDQHACHERKIYDKLLLQMNNNELAVQQLLFPYTFSVSAEEKDFFLLHQEDFQALGIKIVEFGTNIFRIIEMPFTLKNIDFKDFINSVKSKLHSFDFTQKNLLKDFLTQTACKSAVKAGDTLSHADIQALINDLNEHKVLKCPHGRPFVFEITKRDLEKWFKRIV